MPNKKMTKDYKYDVAFSFLSEDEQIVKNIITLLKDRLTSIYIYFERQLELVGKSAMNEFPLVFGHDARTVVVIYKEGWGIKGVTFVEKNAIEQRFLKEGKDFLIIISLDKKYPIWYPPQYIWDDFEKYGIETTVAIIERNVKSQGGKLTESTARNKAETLNRRLEFAEFRKSYRFSFEGVKDANKEVIKLNELLETKNHEIKLENKNIFLNFERVKNYSYQICITGHGFKLQLFWYTSALNNLDGNVLTIQITKGGGYRSQPQILMEKEFTFDINEYKQFIWVSNNKQFSTINLADKILMDFIDLITKYSIDA